MFTPTRVVILGLIVGIGAAAYIELRTPNPPPEPPYPPAVVASPTSQPATVLADGPRRTLPSGLTIVAVKEGTGPEVKLGDSVTINHRGRLYYGGQEFDTSQGGAPLTFVAGGTDLISGIETGAMGMKAGGIRELLIPPQLGYGSQAMGDKIPPNSPLLFDIQVLSIRPLGATTQAAVTRPTVH
jgi:hypothetical protein